MQASQIIVGDETGLLRVYAPYHEFLNDILISKQRSFPGQKIAITSIVHHSEQPSIIYAAFENGVVIKYKIPSWAPSKAELLQRKIESKGHKYSKKFDVKLSLVTLATTIVEDKKKIFSMLHNDKHLYIALDDKIVRLSEDLDNPINKSIKTHGVLKKAQMCFDTESKLLQVVAGFDDKLPQGFIFDVELNLKQCFRGKNFAPDYLGLTADPMSTAIHIDKNAKTFVSGSHRGRIAVYNFDSVKNNRCEVSELTAFKPRDKVNGCYNISVLALNGNYLAVCDVEGSASVINVEKDQSIGSLNRVAGCQTALEWLGDEILVSVGLDRTMKIYMVKQGKITLSQEVSLQQKCRVVSCAENPVWNYVEEDEEDQVEEVEIDQNSEQQEDDDEFMIDPVETVPTKQKLK